jgi:hypothetical protein
MTTSSSVQPPYNPLKNVFGDYNLPVHAECATNSFFSKNMFASTFLLGFSLKAETHDALQNVQLLTFDRFAGINWLFASMHTTMYRLKRQGKAPVVVIMSCN